MSSPTEPASKSHFPRSAGEKETSREILIGVPSYHFPLPAAEIITDRKPIQLHWFFSFFFSNCVFWRIHRIENWRSANASQLPDLDSAAAKVLKNPKIQKSKRNSDADAKAVEQMKWLDIKLNSYAGLRKSSGTVGCRCRGEVAQFDINCTLIYPTLQRI